MVGVRRADELVEELQRILGATEERGRMGPKPNELLADLIALSDELKERLLELQTYVVLEEYSQDDEDMPKAHAFWEAMEPGVRVTKVNDLVSMSPTLSALNTAAVTIKSVHRFSDDDIAIAERIGTELAEYPRYIHELAATGRQHNQFQIKGDAVDNVRNVLRDLSKTGVLTGFHLEGMVTDGDGKGYWREDSKIQRGRKVSGWGVRRGKVRKPYRELLGGHWLTAYTYGIALDQFRRIEVPFEIYSRVEYALPRDRGGGRSDIDVLVRTSDILLCIECKSGAVLDEHRGESAAARTARNAERLDALLDSMQLGLERHHHLIYQETKEEPIADVREAVVGGVPVLVTTPSRLRSTIAQIALGQDLDDVA